MTEKKYSNWFLPDLSLTPHLGCDEGEAWHDHSLHQVAVDDEANLYAVLSEGQDVGEGTH